MSAGTLSDPSAAPEGPGVELTEGESAALFRLSSQARTVSLTFGIGHVWLRDIPSNRWAFDALEDMRAPKVAPV